MEANIDDISGLNDLTDVRHGYYVNHYQLLTFIACRWKIPRSDILFRKWYICQGRDRYDITYEDTLPVMTFLGSRMGRPFIQQDLHSMLGTNSHPPSIFNLWKLF